MRRRATTWFAAILILLGVLDACVPERGGGWTFYTPYSSLYEGSIPDQATFNALGQPMFVSVGAITIFVGAVLATLMQAPRRFVGWALGCYALGAALWLGQRLMLMSFLEAPRRYHYYYLAPDSGQGPGILKLAGTVVVLLGLALSVVPALLSAKRSS